MDQVYLENVKSTNTNKKWVDIDVRGRSLHRLKCKEGVAKFSIFGGHDCLVHHLKIMNPIDSDTCVLCNQNSTMNSEHLYSAVHSTEKDNKQMKSLASTGKQEEKLCKIYVHSQLK